ncbi:MAG TPA: hypothetical protein VF828_04120 [Patescibacteria group bacterium]
MQENRAGSNGNGFEKCSQINQCTLIVGGGLSREKEILQNEVPAKIKRRLRLNLADLCGLATVLLRLEDAKKMNEDDLKTILKYANSVNTLIGLPQTEDLVIRTAKDKYGIFWASDKAPAASEPALLAMGVETGKMRYRLMSGSGGSKEIENLESFWGMAKEAAIVMIHDDNAELQKKAVHGVLGKVPGGIELTARTGSLHARDMGDPSLSYPSIRVEGRSVEEVVDLLPTYTQYRENEGITANRVRVHGVNANEQQMRDIMWRIYRDRGLILNTYKRTKELFGEDPAMEFRLYPDWLKPESRRMHIMDADVKF